MSIKFLKKIKPFDKSVPVELKEPNKWKNVQTDAGKYFAESVS